MPSFRNWWALLGIVVRFWANFSLLGGNRDLTNYTIDRGVKEPVRKRQRARERERERDRSIDG